MNFNLFDDLDDRVVYNRNVRSDIPDNMRMNPDTSSADAENIIIPENTDSNNISAFPENTPLAMAYVPFQQWGKVYDSREGFHKGTLFPDLDFPFMRGGGQGE